MIEIIHEISVMCGLMQQRHFLIAKFEDSLAMIIKKAVSWDVPPCSSCKNKLWGKRFDSIIRVVRTCELGTTLEITII
jgi:hypothetical protein